MTIRQHLPRRRGAVQDDLHPPRRRLLRAMMPGHSEACTFHADSPREAVRRLTTVLGDDAGASSAEQG